MGSFSLLMAAVVVALAGWGWVALTHKAPEPKIDRTAMEQRLKAQGTLKTNGTISTGTDFDAELNAQLKELNSVDTDGTTQLDSAANTQ